MNGGDEGRDDDGGNAVAGAGMSAGAVAGGGRSAGAVAGGGSVGGGADQTLGRRVVAAADVERWVIERESSGERYAVARSRAELHVFVRLMRSAGFVIRVHDVH